MSPTFLHVVIFIAAFGRGSSIDGTTTETTEISSPTSSSSNTFTASSPSITTAVTTITTQDAQSVSTTVESSTNTTSDLSSVSSTNLTPSSAPHTTLFTMETSLSTGTPADNTTTSNPATTSSTMNTSNDTTTIEANTPTTSGTYTSMNPTTNETNGTTTGPVTPGSSTALLTTTAPTNTSLETLASTTTPSPSSPTSISHTTLFTMETSLSTGTPADNTTTSNPATTSSNDTTTIEANTPTTSGTYTSMNPTTNHTVTSMSPATNETNGTTTGPVTPGRSTALLTTTAPTNTSLETLASTTTPSPSLPTSISTSNSVPSNTSSGSSTVPSTGNSTTLSPSTATSRDTSFTSEVTTLSSSTEPSSGNTTASRPTSVSAGPTATSLGPDITTTSAAPTLIPAAVCPFMPCPLQSICLNGTCQCLSGSFLLNDRCVPAQVFPGQLHLTSLTFDAGMSNRSSKIFQLTAAKVSGALRDALSGQLGYVQSDVVQLLPGSVEAVVNNIFENSNATQQSVEQSINDAIAISESTNALLANATFTGTDLCVQDPLPCEVSTTTCQYTNGRPVCFCKEGYISVVYSNTSCRACPSGQRAVGDSCQPCAFGYAGFNCNDSSLLAVVVISCVLGGVLLILILALFILCACQRCSQSMPDYNGSPYSSGELNQPWPTGITPIPRASTTTYDAAPAMEMTEGGSTRTLVDNNPQNNGLSGSYDVNPEGMTTFTGKTPSRYSYLVQGHVNPYFLPGDEKKN